MTYADIVCIRFLFVHGRLLLIYIYILLRLIYFQETIFQDVGNVRKSHHLNERTHYVILSVEVEGDECHHPGEGKSATGIKKGSGLAHQSHEGIPTGNALFYEFVKVEVFVTE